MNILSDDNSINYKIKNDINNSNDYSSNENTNSIFSPIEISNELHDPNLHESDDNDEDKGGNRKNNEK